MNFKLVNNTPPKRKRIDKTMPELLFGRINMAMDHLDEYSN